MKKQAIIPAVALLCLLLAAPRAIFSATDWKKVKFELNTGFSYQYPLLDSSYTHHYSPPFLSGAYVSSAQHKNSIKGKNEWGVNVALTYYPLEDFGLQFQVEYGRPEIKGSNSNYEVWLNYALASPAGNPPYPYVFERTYGWPSTAGDMYELCLSLNPVVRLPLSRRVSLNFSGGLTYFRVKIEGAGLAYSKYWMEEGYFMGETYELKYRLGPINKMGLNLGGELNWVIFHNVALTFDFRFFECSKKTLAVNILPNEMLNEPLSAVKQTMNLGKISVYPAFYRFNLGLKYLF
jgi:hypothetical protein